MWQYYSSICIFDFNFQELSQYIALKDREKVTNPIFIWDGVNQGSKKKKKACIGTIYQMMKKKNQRRSLSPLFFGNKVAFKNMCLSRGFPFIFMKTSHIMPR
jgi:hypothetical protein